MGILYKRMGGNNMKIKRFKKFVNERHDYIPFVDDQQITVNLTDDQKESFLKEFAHLLYEERANLVDNDLTFIANDQEVKDALSSIGYDGNADDEQYLGGEEVLEEHHIEEDDVDGLLNFIYDNKNHIKDAAEKASINAKQYVEVLHLSTEDMYKLYLEIEKILGI